MTNYQPPARNDNPTVSVIIPVFNKASVLLETLQSVLAQSWQKREIIVIDDGSTDSSALVAKGFGKSIVYHYSVNKGAAKARNRGIELATGKYVALLDADDLWESSKLEEQVQMMECNPWLGMVVTDVRHLDWEGRPTGNVSKGYDSSKEFYRLFVKGYIPWPSSVMIRKNVLKEAGGFDDRFGLVGFEDWELWARLGAICDIGYLAKPLTLHRDHNSASSRRESYLKNRALALQILLERFKDDSRRRKFLFREQALCAADLGKYYVLKGAIRDARISFWTGISICMQKAWDGKALWRCTSRLIRSYV